MAVTTELDDRVAPEAQAEADRTFGGNLAAQTTAAVEYYVETQRVIADLLGRAEGGKEQGGAGLAGGGEGARPAERGGGGEGVAAGRGRAEARRRAAVVRQGDRGRQGGLAARHQ